MSGGVEGVEAHARELAHRIIMEFRPNGWEAKENELYRLLLGSFEHLTTPPARSYADGVEDAAKVALKHAGILDLAQGHEDAEGQADRWYDGGKHAGQVIAAAIRLLSQGGKA